MIFDEHPTPAPRGNIAGMTRTLHALLAAAGLPCPAGAEDIAITSITDDSRQVQPGSLFVAYKGVEADGHKYIPNAIERGAAAILFENEWHMEHMEAYSQCSSRSSSVM